MAYTTVFDDIVFVEGDFQNIKIGNTLEYDASSQTTFNKHLKSLKDVKEYFAQIAKDSGYNAIIKFEYGQKSKFFMYDNITFWGKGVLANITMDEYNEIVKQKT
ncbi:MAG: hypothetical protein Ta2G_09620 [Termitinemataceae bacterium]|nr:MAG: hypothetical protein Ta2G_09620 [Termitinemataceae bacterium]